MNSKSLIMGLQDIGALAFGNFTLKNGMQSPFYINLRLLISHPILLREVAVLMSGLAEKIKCDRIAGIPYAALPIATIVSQLTLKPMIFARKEAKAYGTKKLIEGEYKSGETILLLDDMITDGASKLETAQPFLAENLKVSDVVVLIDREQGGDKRLLESGIRLTSVFKISEILAILKESGKISKETELETLEWISKHRVG